MTERKSDTELLRLEYRILQLERRTEELEKFDNSQKKVGAWIAERWWQCLLVTVVTLGVIAEVVAKIKGFI